MIIKKIKIEETFSAYGYKEVHYIYGAFQNNKVGSGDSVPEAIQNCLGCLEKPNTRKLKVKHEA